MLDPETVRQGIEVVGMLLPPFAVGAAIFRINRQVSVEPEVRTVEIGRQNAEAEVDIVGDETFVSIPTAARVDIVLESGESMLQAVDMRKRESRPNDIPKLLIMKGRTKRELNEQGGLIADHAIHEVMGMPGVDVRYLGSINNRRLEGGNLKTIFENGLGEPEES